MAKANRKVKAAAAGVAVACLAAIVPLQTRIDRLRESLVQESVMPTHMPVSAAVSAALGGFRGIAVDILWIQSDAMINDRQFYQLITYYKLISTLQPNFPTVWVHNAWNLAYNISYEWGQPDERWAWIKKGIEFAKEGLQYNPDSEELNFYVGWLYFDKVSKDAYFTRKVYEEEGVEPYLEAHKYAKRAADISLARGETDVRESSFAWLMLYQHGAAVLRTGNVPEAMRYFDEAEEGTRGLAEQFPEDAPIITLVDRIRQTKAQFEGKSAQ